MTPETSYARLGDLHLAYQVLGQGPPDLLPLDLWIGNVEAQWDVPPMAAFRERLASFARVIMFDKRGTGLSDPVPTHELPILEAWVDDAVAVLDAAGSEQAVALANMGGGLMAVSLAAAHPERISSLVLVDCFARARWAPDFPIGTSDQEIEREVELSETGAGRGIMLDFFAPSLADDPVLRRAMGRFERQAASPGNFKALVRYLNDADVRAILPSIRVPTLVIQRAGVDGSASPHGRYLAEHISGAQYVELPGRDQIIWAGDTDALIVEIQHFVTGIRPAPTRDRVLATVLFTDIVGSTRLAAEMGDGRWRELLNEHFRVTRRHLARFGGREVKTVGDGILATFDGPARAVRCAAAIRDDVWALGLALRAGLHTGEIELDGDDVAGLAVHIGARISAMAAAREILVSSTVRDLVIGSGVVFQDRGTHQLKGVPGRWRVFALAA